MTKKYDSKKRIAEYLQNYKKLKTEEKKYSNDKATEMALEGFSDDENKVFSNIMESVDEKKKEYSEKRKEIKGDIDICKSLITEAIKEDVENDPRDIAEETLSFPNIGTVTYVRTKKYIYEGTPEQKKELLDEIYERGLFDLIDINEEKLAELSQEIKKKTGKHIPGLREYNDYETKIR